MEAGNGGYSREEAGTATRANVDSTNLGGRDEVVALNLIVALDMKAHRHVVIVESTRTLALSRSRRHHYLVDNQEGEVRLKTWFLEEI